jgi:hypothetical protein
MPGQLSRQQQAGVPAEADGSPMAPNRVFLPGFLPRISGPMIEGVGSRAMVYAAVLEGSPMAPNRFFSAGSFPKDSVPFFRGGGGSCEAGVSVRRRHTDCGGQSHLIQLGP